MDKQSEGIDRLTEENRQHPHRDTLPARARNHSNRGNYGRKGTTVTMVTAVTKINTAAN
jgi:hypothetical protein